MQVQEHEVEKDKEQEEEPLFGCLGNTFSNPLDMLELLVRSYC